MSKWKFATVAAAGLLLAMGEAAAQQVEDELILITPVAKTLTDPALAEFTKSQRSAGTSR